MPVVELKVSAELLTQAFSLDVVAGRFECDDPNPAWAPDLFTFKVYVPNAPADAVEIEPVYHRDPNTRRMCLLKIIWRHADGSTSKQEVDIEDGTAIGDVVNFINVPLGEGNVADRCFPMPYTVALGCGCPVRYADGRWHRYHREPCTQPGVITVNLHGEVMSPDAIASTLKAALGTWRRIEPGTPPAETEN